MDVSEKKWCQDILYNQLSVFYFSIEWYENYSQYSKSRRRESLPDWFVQFQSLSYLQVASFFFFSNPCKIVTVKAENLLRLQITEGQWEYMQLCLSTQFKQVILFHSYSDVHLFSQLICQFYQICDLSIHGEEKLPLKVRIQSRAVITRQRIIHAVNTTYCCNRTHMERWDPVEREGVPDPDRVKGTQTAAGWT